MALVGLVGWRGMVGSVLMDRMQAEGDFALIEPVFFSTSAMPAANCAPAMAFAKNETKLQDAFDIDALKRCDIVITCQGGDYTTEVFPKLRASGLERPLDRRGQTLRMKDDAVIILDPVNMPVIKNALAKGVAQLDRRQLHRELHADGRGRAVQGRAGRVDERPPRPTRPPAAAARSTCASCSRSTAR
jgi:aspartate-semialdehyde dehydrogenase